jgi:Flp pilus assembly protein TadG
VTVEAAIVLPLLLLLFLGSIDVSQYIDLSQTVTNASRDGARLAARDATTSVSDVEETVVSYLSGRFPERLASEIENGLEVTILRENGSQISGDDLSVLESGEQFTLRVTFDYAAVRWIKALDHFVNSEYTVATVARRE